MPTFACSACGDSFTVTKVQARKLATCPSCGAKVTARARETAYQEAGPDPYASAATMPTFACSACGASFRVKKDQAGKQVTCPSCGAKVTARAHEAALPEARHHGPKIRQEQPDVPSSRRTVLVALILGGAVLILGAVVAVRTVLQPKDASPGPYGLRNTAVLGPNGGGTGGTSQTGGTNQIVGKWRCVGGVMKGALYEFKPDGTYTCTPEGGPQTKPFHYTVIDQEHLSMDGPRGTTKARYSLAGDDLTISFEAARTDTKGPNAERLAQKLEELATLHFRRGDSVPTKPEPPKDALARGGTGRPKVTAPPGPREPDPEGADEPAAGAAPESPAPQPAPGVASPPPVGGRPAVQTPARAPAPPPREAPPDDAALAEALKTVRKLYRADYARSQPAALARKLLGEAETTAGDSTARFALVTEARDLAVKARVPMLALAAVDAMARWYTVKATAMKIQVLEQVSAADMSPAVQKAVGEAALSAIDAALADDDYAGARRLVRLAEAAALKANDANLARQATARADEITQMQQDYSRAMDACVTVGRYLCLVKGRWDEGLALFVHGSNPALRVLGEKASRRPSAPAEVAEVADLLWNWADEEKGSARAKLQARARSLYWQALPGLLGLERTKAEDRLQTTFGRKVLVPGLVAEYFNDTSFSRRVKTRVDYQLDFDWSRSSPDPVVHHDNFGASWRGYLKPPRPGKYTLILTSDNGSRLWLDGRPIFNRLDTNSTPRFSMRITLSDQPHRIAVEFLQGMLGAYIHLKWVPPGESVEQPIPPEAFYHTRDQEKVLHK